MIGFTPPEIPTTTEGLVDFDALWDQLLKD